MGVISELEEEIKKSDYEISQCKINLKQIKSNRISLMNKLSIEREKILNIREGDLHVFDKSYKKISIGTYSLKNFNTIIDMVGITIKIERVSKKFIFCELIKGDLYHESSGVDRLSDKRFYVSKKNLYTALINKSSMGDIMKRHITIEDILN